MSAPTIAYQATDLARNHRAVLDAAKEGGALVRDKDGVALLLTRAESIDREREVAVLALDLVRAGLALMRNNASPANLGDLSWLSVLPEPSQRQFFAEMSEALLLASSGMPMRNVEVLLGDWRATAETWADADAREQLLSDALEPSGAEL